MRKINKQIREIPLPNDSVCFKKGGDFATQNEKTRRVNYSNVELNIKKNGVPDADFTNSLVQAQRFNRVYDDQSYSRKTAREYLNIKGELIPLLSIKEQGKYPSYSKVCSDVLLTSIGRRILDIASESENSSRPVTFEAEERSSSPFDRYYSWHRNADIDFNALSFGGRKINKHYGILPGRDILHSVQFLGTPLYVYVANLLRSGVSDQVAELLIKLDVNPDNKSLMSKRVKDLAYRITNSGISNALFSSDYASKELWRAVVGMTDSSTIDFYLCVKILSSGSYASSIGNKLSFSLLLKTENNSVYRSSEIVMYMDTLGHNSEVLFKINKDGQEGSHPFGHTLTYLLTFILTDIGTVFRVADEYVQVNSGQNELTSESKNLAYVRSLPRAYSDGARSGSWNSSALSALRYKYEKTLSYLSTQKDYEGVMSGVMANCSVIAHVVSPTEMELGYSFITKEKSIYALYIFDEKDGDSDNEMKKLLTAKTLSKLEAKILNYIKAEKLIVVVNALVPHISTKVILSLEGRLEMTPRLAFTRDYRNVIERLPAMVDGVSEEDKKFPGRVLIQKRRMRELKTSMGPFTDLTSVGAAIASLYKRHKQTCEFFLPTFIKLDLIENYLQYDLGLSMPCIELDLIESNGFFPTMYNYFIFSFNKDKVDFVAPFVTGIKQDEVVEGLEVSAKVEKPIDLTCIVAMGEDVNLYFYEKFAISTFINDVNYDNLLSETKIKIYFANGGGLRKVLESINKNNSVIEICGKDYEKKVRWTANNS